MAIGIFDSGLGGLSILKEIIKLMPEYDYIYLGDNARVPYGGRSADLIYQFTTHAVDFLAKQGCGLVILACNSATASALHKLQTEYIPQKYPTIKILGVIKPSIEAAYEAKSKRVGVIGTYATVHSDAFQREIKKLLPHTKVYQTACPLLVPIIEEGKIHWSGLKTALKEYLTPLLRKRIDTLILGCTHYGLIGEEVKKIVGKNITIISEGKIVARKLKLYLIKHSELEIKLSKNKKRTYYITDLNDRYEKLAETFMKKNIKLEQCNIG
jgi:glutamate racemase